MNWKTDTKEMYEMSMAPLETANAYTAESGKNIERTGGGDVDYGEDENSIAKGRLDVTLGLLAYLKRKDVKPERFLEEISKYVQTLFVRRYVYAMGNEDGSFTLVPTLPENIRKVNGELEIEEVKDYESWWKILDREMRDIDNHSPYE